MSVYRKGLLASSGLVSAILLASLSVAQAKTGADAAAPGGVIGAQAEKQTEKKAAVQAPQAQSGATGTSPGGGAPGAKQAVEEIVVTARKRRERLSDIPSSIIYYDNQTLEDADVGTGKDLTRLTPGLSVIDNGSGFNDEFLIRGEGAARQNNAETGSGLFRNGVFIAGGNAGGRNFVPIDFFDVGSVTILRGPQGSFYGRNAVGGAVDIVSQRPTPEFEWSANASYGINDAYKGEAILNMPLTDTIQMRLGAFGSDQSDGFYKSTITGDVLDKEDSWGARGQVAWQPSADIDVNLLVEKTTEYGPNVVAFGQVLPANDPPINPVGSPSGYSVGRFEKAVDTPSYFDRTTFMTALEVSWNLGDIRMQSTTAYRVRNATTLSEVDLFGNNKNARLVPTVSNGSEEFKRWTQDLRFVSDSAGLVDWVAGVELNKVDSTFATLRFPDAVHDNIFAGATDVPSVLPPECSVAPTCTLTAIQTVARNGYRSEASGVDDWSWAPYAAATLKLSDEVRLSADVRYSSDSKSFRLDNVFRLDTPTTPANEQLTRQVLADNTFTKWTPSVSLTWRFEPRHTAYVRLGSGYRAGGYNNDLGEPGDSVSAIAVPISYDAEFVRSVEAGVRGLLDGWLRYDLNAYYNTKDNTLVNYSVFVGTTATNTVRNVGVLGSAGESHQSGVDGELRTELDFIGGKLSPRFGFSWADGEYDGGRIYSNAQSNPATTLTLVSIDGKRLGRLRDWTTSSSLTWRGSIGDGFNLMAMLSRRSESGGFEDPNNNNEMDDVTLYDGAIGIESNQWRLVASGKNILDTSYYNISPINQSFNAQQNEPATWTVTLGVKMN
jgi:iron complex outermembrane receptor protein